MTRRLARPLSIGLIAGLGAIPASAQPIGITTQRDLSYGPLPAQTLTVCRPNDDKPHAGVVLIHGGGWVNLDKAMLMPLCEALARDGLFAATIDYRLVKKGSPDTRWPAQLADVQLAVRWLRANSARIKLDREHICAYGESAGGHLAVFLAAKATIEPSDMAGYLAGEPVSVLCAVDNFGPVDLTRPGPLKELAEPLVGKTLRSGNMAAFREASPLFLVGPHTAPIFIEQGSGDQVVPPAQSLRLFGALAKHAVQARLVSYPGGHGWKNVAEPEKSYLAQEERQFLRLFLSAAARPIP